MLSSPVAWSRIHILQMVKSFATCLSRATLSVNISEEIRIVAVRSGPRGLNLMGGKICVTFGVFL